MSLNYRVILAHLNKRAEEQSMDEHHEEELGMLHGNIKNTIDAAEEIQDFLEAMHDNSTEVEPWMVSKITIAEDYIDTVRDVLKNRK